MAKSKLDGDLDDYFKVIALTTSVGIFDPTRLPGCHAVQQQCNHTQDSVYVITGYDAPVRTPKRQELTAELQLVVTQNKEKKKAELKAEAETKASGPEEAAAS